MIRKLVPVALVLGLVAAATRRRQRARAEADLWREATRGT
jgi:hypothetical protein